MAVRRGLYSFALIPIQTPEINQSSQDESEKCSSAVGLTIQLVKSDMACLSGVYGLSW